MHEKLRNILLVFEIKTSISFIQRGLGEIQKITGANDFYDPALQFLSSGFERLFKIMLCLKYKEENNRLPSYQELLIGKNGHDIVFLKSEIEKICIPVKQPFASMDYDIITQDDIINRICLILSEYAQKARYFNFDIIMGKQQKFNSVEQWEKLSTEILINKLGYSKYIEILEQYNQIDALYNLSSNLIVEKIELFIRAVTRQFLFGNFSNESKTFIFEIDSFSSLDDSKIGKIDYRF